MRRLPKTFGKWLPLSGRPIIAIQRRFFSQDVEELLKKAALTGQNYFLMLKKQLKDELDSGAEMEAKRVRSLLKNLADLSQVDSFVQFDADTIQQHTRLVRELAKTDLQKAQNLAAEFYSNLRFDRIPKEAFQEITANFLEIHANQLSPLSQSGLRFLIDFLYFSPPDLVPNSQFQLLQELFLKNFEINFQNASMDQKLKLLLLITESSDKKVAELLPKIQEDIKKNLVEISDENLSFFLRAMDQGLPLDEKEKILLEEIFENLIKQSCQPDMIWSTLARVFTPRLLDEFSLVLINTMPAVQNDRKIDLLRNLVTLKLENSELGNQLRNSLDLEVNKLSQIEKWFLLTVLAQSQKELAHTSLAELYDEVISEPFGDEISEYDWHYALKNVPQTSKLTSEQTEALRKKAAKYLEK